MQIKTGKQSNRARRILGTLNTINGCRLTRSLPLTGRYIYMIFGPEGFTAGSLLKLISFGVAVKHEDSARPPIGAFARAIYEFSATPHG